MNSTYVYELESMEGRLYLDVAPCWEAADTPSVTIIYRCITYRQVQIKPYQP